MTEKAKLCSICQREFSPQICFDEWTVVHGNNAEPVNSGKCCDFCNQKVVMPARLNLMLEVERRQANV